jgi:cytochrome c peroxidase
VRLSQTELRGYLLFNDPAKANCAGCHLDQANGDGLPPLFTDDQFEALGVPRNMALNVNRDPAWFDLGICGPIRTDMADQTEYCGMFLTPTLRNVAVRRVLMHNGVYHSLRQAMDFDNLGDTDPGAIYPTGRAERSTNSTTFRRRTVPISIQSIDRWTGPWATSRRTASRTCGTSSPFSRR